MQYDLKPKYAAAEAILAQGDHAATREKWVEAKECYVQGLNLLGTTYTSLRTQSLCQER